MLTCRTIFLGEENKPVSSCGTTWCLCVMLELAIEKWLTDNCFGLAYHESCSWYNSLVPQRSHHSNSSMRTVYVAGRSKTWPRRHQHLQDKEWEHLCGCTPPQLTNPGRENFSILSSAVTSKSEGLINRFTNPVYDLNILCQHTVASSPYLVA